MTQITTDGTVDQLELPVLSALDRCDLCGAQAYIRVTLESGELLFCAHHGAQVQGEARADGPGLGRPDEPPLRR